MGVLPDAAVLYSLITYTVTVTNAGLIDGGVQIEDTIDTTWQAVVSVGGTCGAPVSAVGDTYTWDVALGPDGASCTIVITTRTTL